MIIKLIIPRRKNANVGLQKYDLPFSSMIMDKKMRGTIMYSMPLIAALTPKNIKVVIQDENIEQIKFDEKVNLVGITANVSLALRAYEIADEFRRRGITVVIGGIHTSLFQQEGLEHADSLVIGEAENVWADVIRDFIRKDLKKIYEGKGPADINKQPLPRYNLVKNEKYSYYTVQTVSGCSSQCDYCAIHTYPKWNYRCKNVDRVIDEVKYLNLLGKKLIYFCDSNFAINFKRAKELMRKLIRLKISYVTQARIEIFRDPELLELLHDSGCVNIVTGLETINQKNLYSMNKKYNVDLYQEAIHTIQKKGLLVTGSFMLGFDNDDITVFESMVDFINKSSLGASFLNIVTPLPGTPLYCRLEKEGRILHRNWTDYDFHHVCFRPKNMTTEELANGYLWASQQAYSLQDIYNRVLNLYKVWNANDVRKKAREIPLLLNLNLHYAMKSYPRAIHPRDFGNKSRHKKFS